ncbi:DUF1573 domain-containing protein [Niastella populi]|uniref:DUF1573 domain-containing protein n=1 Tax=Niastella populi TaxID=550983 RepID=A0A1V9F0R2_9BACT|nr:DUF1573 domain-containing protein [Niastella populi]OQP51930.1 hypothetical protein A4R26_28945 [Niastella populi]
MKSFVLAFAALLVTAGVFAQTAPAATVVKASSYVKFKELSHDFGKIKQNSPVTYNFVFTNISDKPVVIESATASCGCTTPVKPEAPVGKGKEDKITAGFNAAAAGPFNKIIYIKVAGVDQPMELKITGEVLNAEDYAKFEKEKGNKKG